MAPSENAENKLTWSDLMPETFLRNVLVQQAEQHLDGLEAFNKREITQITFDTTQQEVMSTINEIKAIHATFRKKVQENDLLQDPDYIVDSKALVAWYLLCYQQLGKLQPGHQKGASQPVGNVLTSTTQSTVMHDALYTLQRTLQSHNDERSTTANLTKPHFKGGVNSYIHYELYKKEFRSVDSRHC